ncbi:short-chain dehydrogenase [Methyloceanibacter methanicus]|uniref:Short-chain dehydrogenase n=1 Tax=Methyloceanibacter methanicus TaxID=1774968 RepID=A0A1E3W322_9HYPH|nr:SDR family oxidoreductase [Methyloceanibacter methanicus]ODS00196.1 short-chain dehydrogenase [Methyloceanibacter methanicus]
MESDSPAACALVTGAARRLGRAIALDLARHGWRVGVHYQTSEADARGLVAEIEGFGGRAAALQADLSDLEALPMLIETCAAALGPATCLVNNAACFAWDWPDQFDEAGWTRHHEVNLRAPVFLAQAFANALPSGADGNVINLIDQKVHALTPHYFTYTIAKSALWTATRTLAQALAPRIRVNAVAPGPVLPYEGQSDEDFARECRDTLLKHAVPIDDVTATVRFLLETGSITGQMIAVDGGRHLNWRPDAS